MSVDHITIAPLKGTVKRDFTALVFFIKSAHYAAGSKKKIVSWESFNT
jgi:hypothetical protein